MNDQLLFLYNLVRISHFLRRDRDYMNAFSKFRCFFTAEILLEMFEFVECEFLY